MTIGGVVGAVFGLYVVGFGFGIVWAMVFNFFEQLLK
jgi:hypothetical protein